MLNILSHSPSAQPIIQRRGTGWTGKCLGCALDLGVVRGTNRWRAGATACWRRTTESGMTFKRTELRRLVSSPMISPFRAVSLRTHDARKRYRVVVHAKSTTSEVYGTNNRVYTLPSISAVVRRSEMSCSSSLCHPIPIVWYTPRVAVPAFQVRFLCLPFNLSPIHRSRPQPIQAQVFEHLLRCQDPGCGRYSSLCRQHASFKVSRLAIARRTKTCFICVRSVWNFPSSHANANQSMIPVKMLFYVVPNDCHIALWLQTALNPRGKSINDMETYYNVAPHLSFHSTPQTSKRHSPPCHDNSGGACRHISCNSCT
jgi:hypothetical protein